MHNIEPYSPRNSKVRPITAAIHPRLVNELEIRKNQIESETGRPVEGGKTSFSEMAAMELWSLRQSGKRIMEEILKIKCPEVYKFQINGVETEFVPYWIFKKLFILSSTLSRRKDHNPIRVEIKKIKGLKKNEIKFFWQ